MYVDLSMYCRMFIIVHHDETLIITVINSNLPYAFPKCYTYVLWLTSRFIKQQKLTLAGMSTIRLSEN